MKTYIPYSLLLAAAACGLAYGQTTATTTPVGYVAITTPAESDSTYAPVLNRATELQTVATAASGSVLTINATGINLDQFVFAPPGQPKTYYVKFLTGTLAGRYFNIQSNTATASGSVDLTLDAPVSITGTPTVAIAPHWTLGSAFPAGSGVGASLNPADPIAFLFKMDQDSISVDKGSAALYFYFDDAENAGAASGWYNNDDIGAGPQDDSVVIYPDELCIIRNTTGASVDATIIGEVPVVGAVSTIVVGADPNDNLVGSTAPVDMTLPETGLLQSGAFTASLDPAEPIDFVLVYDDLATGIDKAPAALYFYFDDVANAGAASGWYNNDDLGAGPQDAEKVIKAGRGFTVRKASGTPGSLNWNSTLPYSL